jgi:hypothetical protein
MKLPLAQANITSDRFGLDEQTLIKRAASGDLDAFNQLVLCYQNMHTTMRTHCSVMLIPRRM